MGTRARRGITRWMAPTLCLAGALLMTTAGATDAAAGSTAAAASATTTMLPTNKLNIVEIMTDDMRYDDLAYMPNLQQQIARGVMFENSFSSFPLCCPARTDFLSGLLNHNNHVYGISGSPTGHGGYTFFNDKRSIGTALQHAGYNTGFVGKYLNGYGADYKQAVIRRKYAAGSVNADLDPDNDVPPGWTIWRGSLDGNLYSADPPELNGTGTHPGSTYKYLDMTTSTNAGRWVRHRGRYSTYLVDHLAVNQIEKFHTMRATGGKPFFMSVNFVAPHVGFPRRPEDEVNGVRFRTAYTPPATDAPFQRFLDGRGLTFDRGAGINKPPLATEVGSYTDPSLHDQPWHDQEIDASDVEWTARNDYRRAQSLWLVDQQLPKLVAALKATGEWKRTVVFFTSDNGFFLGENGMPNWKVITLEPSLRVPLAAFGGAVPRTDVAVSAPATTVDLSATIMAMAKATPPWGYSDGRSLWPAMTSDPGWTRVARFESQYPDLMPTPAARLNHFSIRTPRYYYGVSEGIVEMYDLQVDPLEWHNLVQRDGTVDLGYADVASTLSRLLRETMSCRGDAQCEPPLPPSLAQSADQADASYNSWYDAVHSMIGNFRAASRPAGSPST